MAKSSGKTVNLQIRCYEDVKDAFMEIYEARRAQNPIESLQQTLIHLLIAYRDHEQCVASGQQQQPVVAPQRTTPAPSPAGSMRAQGPVTPAHGQIRTTFAPPSSPYRPLSVRGNPARMQTSAQGNISAISQAPFLTPVSAHSSIYSDTSATSQPPFLTPFSQSTGTKQYATASTPTPSVKSLSVSEYFDDDLQWTAGQESNKRPTEVTPSKEPSFRGAPVTAMRRLDTSSAFSATGTEDQELLDRTVNHEDSEVHEELDNEENEELDASDYLEAQLDKTLIESQPHPFSQGATSLRATQPKFPRKPLCYKRKEAVASAGEEDTDRRIQKVHFDYSKSLHLLPVGYESALSRGTQCRLYQPRQPDNLPNGYVPPKLSKSEARIPKYIDPAKVVEQTRIIVELNQLAKLISPKCYHADCPNFNDLTNLTQETRRDGAAVIMRIWCVDSVGNKMHKKEWQSSRQLQHQTLHNCRFYAINLLLPSAVLLSGNSWSNVEHFFKVLNVYATSHQHFVDMQRYCMCPAVISAWRMTTTIMAETLKKANANVVVALDGQSDSPGTCATYTTSTAMITVTRMPKVENPQIDDQSHWNEVPSAYIAAIDIIDKRQTDLASARMETVGFLRNIYTLVQFGFLPSEVVTDQHPTIFSLMNNASKNTAAGTKAFFKSAKEHLKHFSDMNDDETLKMLRDLCSVIRHRLDVWHKAKLISADLAELKLGQGGNRPDYLLLVKAIKNHFWYCAETSNGDAVAMRDKWLSLLHHIRDEHVWAGGCCSRYNHQTGICGQSRDRTGKYQFLRNIRPLQLIPRNDEGKRVMTRDEKVYYHVQNAITSPKVLDYLQHFTFFRQTGELESFHALTLSYCPKRIFYGFIGMTCRKLLAALDHNHHVPRQQQTYEDGTPVYGVKYSKRAADWIEVDKKVPKGYEHIPHLLRLILHIRSHDKSIHTKKKSPATTILANDPRLIAPNTARCQKTQQDVLQNPKSRFATILSVVESNRAEVREHEEILENEGEIPIFANLFDDDDQYDDEFN